MYIYIYIYIFHFQSIPIFSKNKLIFIIFFCYISVFLQIKNVIRQKMLIFLLKRNDSHELVMNIMKVTKVLKVRWRKKTQRSIQKSGTCTGFLQPIKWDCSKERIFTIWLRALWQFEWEQTLAIFFSHGIVGSFWDLDGFVLFFFP